MHIINRYGAPQTGCREATTVGAETFLDVSYVMVIVVVFAFVVDDTVMDVSDIVAAIVVLTSVVDDTVIEVPDVVVSIVAFAYVVASLLERVPPLRKPDDAVVEVSDVVVAVVVFAIVEDDAVAIMGVTVVDVGVVVDGSVIEVAVVVNVSDESRSHVGGLSGPRRAEPRRERAKSTGAPLVTRGAPSARGRHPNVNKGGGS